MAGATIGVAILGAIYAVAQGGADGLRFAMLFGGALQITCTVAAWRTMASK
jgi:DHA2 family methylenomycin A resistance protein-like MFS transporter